MTTSGQPNSDKQSIAESGERLRALLTASSDVIYSLSADWSVMRELDGRGFLKDTHEPITDWKSINVHPADMDLVNATIHQAISEKKIFQLEHRVNRADGSPGWTFSRAVPILDDKGEIIEWFGTASDITDRKQAEDALQKATEQSEQQRRVYETIISNTPDLMYVFDLNYRFTFANSALLSMWGKTWEDAAGKSLLENGYEPWHAEMHEREIDQVKTTKRPIRGEVSFPHATLGRRVYDYIFTPVLNEQGEVEAVAGTTRDITERKNWEESLAHTSEKLHAINEEMAAVNEEQAASNEELMAANEELALVNQQLLRARRQIEEGEAALRLAIDAAGLGTYYINAADRIFVASPKLKEFFGFRPDEEVPYDAAINQIHPDYRQQAADLVEAAFTKGIRFDLEYPIIGHHDNKIRWVRGIGEMLHYDGKDFFTGVLHEITEKKQDELRKNDFIGMVSHELKTPLTSLSAILQVAGVRLKTSDDDFLVEATNKANIQVKRISTMINGFLNISRLESGKLMIDKTHFDIEVLVREVSDELRLTTTSHTISLNLCQPIDVLADRDKITSVLTNLVSNAVKYSPAGTTVSISCATTENEVMVSVRDEGIGIHPSDAVRIFDRYFRVESSNTRHIAGFGIGLYLSSEIIKRHNGKIWLESELGNGATFYFTLPL